MDGNERSAVLLLRCRRRGRRQCSNHVAILQVSLNRGDDYPCLDGHQINPDDRDTHPRIDHDAFIEHSVENVDQTGACRWLLQRHAVAVCAETDELSLPINGRGTTGAATGKSAAYRSTSGVEFDVEPIDDVMNCASR